MLSARFEELASAQTAAGIISLRRRFDPRLHAELYEVKLGDEYLMSSRFTEAEVELARLGLSAVEGTSLDVVIGGLGLGFTARAALEEERVNSLIVIEAVEAVIRWHERELVPTAAELTSDPRTQLVHGDFFEMAVGDEGFDPERPGRRFDAVLVDIDHTPRNVLDPSHAGFYIPESLDRFTRHLRPGGAFALWSDDPPDDGFLGVLDEVFEGSQAHVITFANPYTGGESANTVYVATWNP